MAVKIKHFIGVDVSKNKLDLVILNGNNFIGHDVIANNVEDIKTYLKAFTDRKGFTLKNSVFCMEETGIYTTFLLRTLEKKSANIVIENAYHIKNSLGLKREKSDKMDAHSIALYAYKNREELKLYQGQRPVMESLKLLESLRTRMITLRVALNNTLNEQKIYLRVNLFAEQEELTKECKDALIKSTDLIENKIQNIFLNDEHIDRLMTVVTSVTGIGPVTARHIILTTNEFKKISDPRKYACYAGVAPFKRSSGNIESKARISRIANIKIKSLLTMCAINAIKTDDTLKAYYLRKTKVEGKNKMCVINAIRYKLILRVFACVKQNRIYIKS